MPRVFSILFNIDNSDSYSSPFGGGWEGADLFASDCCNSWKNPSFEVFEQSTTGSRNV
jgi:hypothetical protein